MINAKNILLGAALAVASAGMASASTVNVVEAPTGYFLPTTSGVYDSPYYRGASSDWQWAHGAIASGFTSANLWISAFDVDFVAPSPFVGERDAIYANDSGTWTFLGYLNGLDSDWGYTTFTLGSNFFDDIATGLQVKIDIDEGGEGWFVTLAKSVLTTDGASAPPPEPGAQVPVPAAGWLLIAGMGGLAALRRRKKA